jgi:hypothetical protein
MPPGPDRTETPLKTYRFARPLTEKQALYLLMVIGSRRGATLLCAGEPERVVGCVADPRDLAAFLQRYPRRVSEGQPAEPGTTTPPRRRQRDGTGTVTPPAPPTHR